MNSMNLIKYLLTILSSVVLVVEPSFSHEWYAPACCSKKDCRPILVGELKFTSEGWQYTPTGETLALNDNRIRDGRDHQLHICLTPRNEVICLYLPYPGT